jgi:hypothetical protein
VYTNLSGVHATTSGDVWAVGSDRVPYRTLIVHCYLEGKPMRARMTPTADTCPRLPLGVATTHSRSVPGPRSRLACFRRWPRGTPWRSAGTARGGWPCPAPVADY